MASPPYTCPFLDPPSGACLIYEHRPAACRTYGFYVDDRGAGLYCGIIRQQQESGAYPDAVWGHHAAVECCLDAFGKRIPLAEVSLEF